MKGSLLAKILVLFSVFALAGCLGRNQTSTELQLASTESGASTDKQPGPGGSSGGNPTMVAQILRLRCTSCHSETGRPENGINYITDLRRLQDMGHIIPGDAANSEVVKDAKGESDTCDSPRISDEEIKEISDYIDDLQ